MYTRRAYESSPRTIIYTYARNHDLKIIRPQTDNMITYGPNGHREQDTPTFLYIQQLHACPRTRARRFNTVITRSVPPFESFTRQGRFQKRPLRAKRVNVERLWPKPNSGRPTHFEYDKIDERRTRTFVRYNVSAATTPHPPPSYGVIRKIIGL